LVDHELGMIDDDTLHPEKLEHARFPCVNFFDVLCGLRHTLVKQILLGVNHREHLILVLYRKLAYSFRLEPKVLGSVVLLEDKLVLWEDSRFQTRTKPTNELLVADVPKESKLAENSRMDFNRNLRLQMQRELLYERVYPAQVRFEVECQ
jgi:hypothetical protein